MKVEGKHYRTIWDEDGDVYIIDQTRLPRKFVVEKLNTFEDGFNAIKGMKVRGAGLIGATAAYTMWLAAREIGNMRADGYRERMQEYARLLKTARPTAVNLAWAVDQQIEVMERSTDLEADIRPILAKAQNITDEDANACEMIGEFGAEFLMETLDHEVLEQPINILTHCNAGWLAFADWGSATAPIYKLHDQGVDVHVWVDETRPWSQGAKLTMWELMQHGVPCTLIADNVGGHLMQHGLVDLCIVGTDRTTRTGYVANKIGTYLKALAANDNGVPFYVALPTSTFDLSLRNGIKEIPIEQRGEDEVKFITGLDNDGVERKVLVTLPDAKAANYGFDVTPPKLISGLITEFGIINADEESIMKLFQ